MTESERAAEQRFWYAGCLHGVGHFLHPAPYHFDKSLDRPDGWPWEGHWDNGLTKVRSQPQGTAWLHKKDGWSVLVIADRTVDSRPGSHSSLIADADVSADNLLDLLREHFPDVMVRLLNAGGVDVVVGPGPA